MKGSLLLLALACVPALTFGQSLRCSNKIISEGTTSQELATLCGEPAQVERKTIYNDVSAPAPTSTVTASLTIEIHLEMWIYNFGPNQLMQRVWIQDGVITRIDSLGRYGS